MTNEQKEKLAEVAYKNMSNTAKLQHIFPDAIVTIETGNSGKVIKVNGQTACRLDTRGKLTPMINAYLRWKQTTVKESMQRDFQTVLDRYQNANLGHTARTAVYGELIGLQKALLLMGESVDFF